MQAPRGFTAHRSQSMLRRQVDSRWLAALVLIAAAGSVYEVFWPGLLDWDTVQIIAEAQHGPIVDWWTGLGTILLHAWFALGLGIGLLWAACVAANIFGLYGCLRLGLRRTPAALTTMGITLFPPIYGQLASFSRDNAFMGFTLLMFAALARTVGSRAWSRRGWLTAAVVSAVLASICRQNGLVDVGAVVVFTVLQGCPLTWRRLTCAVVAGVTASAASYVSVSVVQQLGGVRATHASRATLVYDLAAMSIETGKDQFPQKQLAGLGPGTASPVNTSLPWLRRHFDPWDEALMSGVVNMKVTDTQLDSREYHVLETAWLAAVLDHPLDYLIARARLSGFLLGSSAPPSADADGGLSDYDGLNNPSNYGHPLAFPVQYAVATAWLADFIGPEAPVPLDRGWVYLTVLAVGAAVAWRRRAALRGLTAALMFAVAFNQAVLFFVAPAASFRYVLILPPAALIVLALATAPRGHREPVVDSGSRKHLLGPVLAGFKPRMGLADMNTSPLVQQAQCQP